VVLSTIIATKIRDYINCLIDELPNEILSAIITYCADYKTLGSLSRVSKRWSLLCDNNSFWKYASFLRFPYLENRIEDYTYIKNWKIWSENKMKELVREREHISLEEEMPSLFSY